MLNLNLHRSVFGCFLVLKLCVQFYLTGITFCHTVSSWNKIPVPGKAAVYENSHSPATENLIQQVSEVNSGVNGASYCLSDTQKQTTVGGKLIQTDKGMRNTVCSVHD